MAEEEESEIARDPTEDKIINAAGLAELSAAAMRVFVLNKPESDLDKAQSYVRMRCEEAARMLDFCADRINALETFVTEILKHEHINTFKPARILLDDLMTAMEDASAEYNEETKEKSEGFPPSAQCSDCNKILVLKKGQDYDIEVGDNNNVVGVLCPACAERLKRAKRAKRK